MKSIPSLYEFQNLIPDETICIEYLASKKVFYESIECCNCKKPMKRYLESMNFRCNNRECTKVGNRVSIKTGTFFFGSNLTCLQIMKLALLWLAEVPSKAAIILSGHGSETVTTFYRYFRQLVSNALREEDTIIGGPGVIVEIDETKLGKRKYNRGHRVDGVWVIVGIERNHMKKIFLVEVEDRTSKTIHKVISEHVIQGSEIQTDMFRSYNGIETAGYTHLTVNHSQNFKDPVTHACTNTVEGLNSGLKRKIPIRNRTKDYINHHLGEYVWRRQNKNALFESFISAMRDIQYNYE